MNSSEKNDRGDQNGIQGNYLRMILTDDDDDESLKQGQGNGEGYIHSTNVHSKINRILGLD